MCETSSFIAKEYFVRGLGAKRVLSSSQILPNFANTTEFHIHQDSLVNRFVIAQVSSVFIKKELIFIIIHNYSFIRKFFMKLTSAFSRHL